ncbi:unnamed protein product, partial [Mesorhabditis spiculigera]
MRTARSPLVSLARFVRKRAGPSGILDEGATYSDFHHVATGVNPDLPYKEKDIRMGLELNATDVNKHKDPKRKLRKLTGTINFDHIPRQEQCVLLFPGQGAQFVGMGKKVLDCKEAKQRFEEASAILGYDLEKLCLEGPETKLCQTVYCQPAVFVSSIAALEKLRLEDEGVATKTTDVAGFSVGEYSALVAGGALSFEDALRVLKRRAEAMHNCNQLTSAGMITVRVNASSRLDAAIKAAREFAAERKEIGICDVANYLFCGVKVVKRLAVSGAFHTLLMADAVPEVLDELKKVELRPPVCNVYSNMSGAVFPTKSREMRHMIARQLVSPVLWEQIQQLLYRRKQDDIFPRYIEVGPGKQLGAMWAQTSKKGYKTYESYSC